MATGSSLDAGRALATGGKPDHGHVAPDEQQDHREHGVGVGAKTAEEPEVLDENPVGQAEHDERSESTQDEARPSAEEERADRRQAATTKRLTAHPCAPTKEAKDDTHDERNEGWDVCDIAWTMPLSVPPRPCQ